MDKNTIIGIVLMIGLFVGYSFYQNHEMKEQQEILDQKAKSEQLARAEQVAMEEAERMLEEQMTPEERFLRDSLAELERTNGEISRHGATLYQSRQGIVKMESVRNDFFEVIFDNRGGKIANVLLNNHTR